MARGVPVQPETRAKIIKLIRQEVARNEIARQCGVSPTTVTRIAKAEGLAFDRSATKVAVAAHKVDLAESRQLLAEKMLIAAHGMLDSIDSPYEVFNFGGKDNTFNSHTFDTPPVEVKRNILTTAGIAFDKASRIVEADRGVEGLAPVESMLGRLAQRFGLVDTDE